jgi:alpha-D-xyloside xylohydrolase
MLFSFLLLACNPPAVDDPGMSRFGGATGCIEIQHAPFGLSFLRDGEEVAALADGGLAFGTSDEDLNTFNHDPYNLVADHLRFAIPLGPTWLEVTRAEPVDGGLALYGGGERLGTLTTDGERIEITTEVAAPYVRIDFAAGPEGYYGLGETFDAVEQTGTIRAMQIELASELESEYNEAHVPVPFLVGSGGWGWLVDSTRPGVFDVGATDSDRLTAIFDSPSGLAMELYTGDHPKDVIAAMHRSQGMPKLPPTWAFGILQWQNEVTGSDQVREDAAAMRQHGIPASVLWVDNPWQTTYNSLEPDPARFPDWDALIDELHDDGFRMLAWTTPYVEQADPEYDQFVPYFVDAPILFSDFGDLVDLTHPEGVALWAERVLRAKDNGIEGWKLDYGEDVQIGMGSGTLEFLFHNGEDERSMHHDFSRYYHHAHADPYGEDEVFLLGRAGVLRGWTVTDCIWPGDLDSDFKVFGEDGHVGGLPAAIRGGTSLAASGYPFFASDTGGYRHNRPTHESMVRWTEYAALLPIFQFGGGGEDHNPWNFTAYGVSEFTQDTLDAFVRYAKLHTRLFPTFYSLAVDSHTTGVPGLLPVGLAFPDAGQHPHDAFMVGSALLVAPVETEGATSREVVFPPGEWVHWWRGTSHSGTETIDAPLGEGPLFQQAGTTVALLREGIETLAPSTTSDSWFEEAGTLVLQTVPGEGSEFKLHDGTRLTTHDDGLSIEVGSLYTQGYSVRVWAPDAAGIKVDGASATGIRDGSWWVVDLNGPASVTVY